MSANGGRWRYTEFMPRDVTEHFNWNGHYFETKAGTIFTWQEAVEWGWFVPVPWPEPELVGSFQ